MPILHLRITGRVQGVGYRAWLDAEARGLGLEGWARNRRDGAVEAVVSGPDAAVSTLVAACWRGPGASAVLAVEAVPAQPGALERRRAGESFSVLPTL